MTPATLEKTIAYVQQFYAWVESLQVSPGFLLGMAALFAIAGVLALREAASWFFKVEDIKSDLARLHDSTAQLESEIRLIQTMLREAAVTGKQDSGAISQENVASIPATQNEAIEHVDKPIQFPIHH